jgi:hypothetical protein
VAGVSLSQSNTGHPTIFLKNGSSPIQTIKNGLGTGRTNIYASFFVLKPGGKIVYIILK